ncbi:MAG: energy transducer TonB [Candidatus Marinimicrobia bacterium]|nr:energy transducer TonB [Candidatus Neomarinimicrobiota bacterium]
MSKTKLTLAALVLLLGATQLMAEPKSDAKCCQPMPAGGMAALERNIIYPTFDRLVGNSADVILNFHVDVNGNVSNIKVARSGGANFDNSAVSAVMNTEWKPAMQNGFPVALTFALPFEYRYK